MIFSRFKQRSLEPERLDRGDFTREEYARWRQEMWYIHRAFGELRALRRSLLKDVRSVDSPKISILDVGAGSGELLHAIFDRVSGRRLTLVGAELGTDAARSIKTGSSNGGVIALQCDALELPFGNNSFDYVFSSLFLHHLTDAQAEKHLSELNRVSRRKFFIIDLHRHPLAYYFYKVAGALFLQRFTREDGALSILRSFRPEELRKLAANAGFPAAQIERSAAFRLVLTGNKEFVGE